ncbi:hypothetical protein [Sphingomonas sp. URHD0057]|uniref:hypothetical protein n=1 Tax=Sphingomonas sp. URHD0057 TaxID=1380389 RepID=UPI000491764C|nr:hypothetical protein [Sphingomonas sp. URHD0057]
MHKQLKTLEMPTERVSWVLDNAWPETASMLGASFGKDDQLLAPGIVGAWPARYRWPRSCRHVASLATAQRHWAMRRASTAGGAVRQRTYLKHDRLVARQLARHIDYRARHLVVAQSWLPWLDEAGVLGGRSFDVVMSRYPLAEIHRLLDQAAAEIGDSATIADFRASNDLVAREAELLARARRVYTPHHGIAAMFPGRAVVLSWHKPPVRPRRAGNRIAFLGPTIARQRPDVARRLVAAAPEPLVVFGATFEPMWDGLAIERREAGPNWLDGIGALVHPATLTHEPRPLLEARAQGVPIYATGTCGLDPSDYRPLDQFPDSSTG